MLWHWRTREAYNSIFTEESIGNIVKNTFGKQYLEILSKIAYIDINEKDFVLRNASFCAERRNMTRNLVVVQTMP